MSPVDVVCIVQALDGQVLLVQPVVGGPHPDVDRRHQPYLVPVILDVACGTQTWVRI